MAFLFFSCPNAHFRLSYRPFIESLGLDDSFSQLNQRKTYADQC
ncbi:protein of unknown function [Shewanella benthica]|uniref:Uncharacterized protein n=1 Tax=Shewanella benthica TaxID=43661 RepID=A0A330M496_9GAMM|nr:protein of unknown function [Shewanella benthica]